MKNTGRVKEQVVNQFKAGLGSKTTSRASNRAQFGPASENGEYDTTANLPEPKLPLKPTGRVRRVLTSRRVPIIWAQFC